SAFGTSQPGSSYDPSILTGWGHRAFNWEFSTGVQQEVMPRVSVEVNYFRRWYGNQLVTDSRAYAPSDYTQFSITAPSDARLPGGDRKSTRLNSSHGSISYAVFCLKKKNIVSSHHVAR